MAEVGLRIVPLALSSNTFNHSSSAAVPTQHAAQRLSASPLSNATSAAPFHAAPSASPLSNATSAAPSDAAPSASPLSNATFAAQSHAAPSASPLSEAPTPARRIAVDVVKTDPVWLSAAPTHDASQEDERPLGEAVDNATPNTTLTGTELPLSGASIADARLSTTEYSGAAASRPPGLRTNASTSLLPSIRVSNWVRHG